jgi:tetratricopeptide (TPR) repeat protein
MGWYHQAGFRYNNQWEKFNYLTLVGYILIIALLFFYKLPGIWFILGLLPMSNMFATNSFLQDRYLYFPSIAIAMIIAPYIQQYPELFYCVMTFYITRTYMYSRHLKNDEMLYRENWRNHPKSDYAINNLAFFLIQKGKFDEARVIIEQGLNIDRTNKMLWYNLGITHAAQGNFSNDEGKLRFIRALDCWKTCLQIEPRWTKPANDLKKLIQLLVDNKVLSISPQEGGNSMEISIPNLTGVQEIIGGKVENTNNGT